jgi:uncharacterized surface protein with fasciclin (FAS1) repeats
MTANSLATEAPVRATPPGRTTSDPHAHDILTTAEGSARLGVFVDFMRAAGLAHLLLGAGPFTLLAPTDRAFMKLSLRERDALLADPPRLSRTMRGHVIAGNVFPTHESLHVSTLDGDSLALARRGDAYYFGEARIVQANIVATNGTIHAIDSVLL